MTAQFYHIFGCALTRNWKVKQLKAITHSKAHVSIPTCHYLATHWTSRRRLATANVTKLLYCYCHETSEKLLKVIAYLDRMSIQSVIIVTGLHCTSQNSGGRVTEEHDGFCLFGKALILDI